MESWISNTNKEHLLLKSLHQKGVAAIHKYRDRLSVIETYLATVLDQIRMTENF